jgi:hypothetical protein
MVTRTQLSKAFRDAEKRITFVRDEYYNGYFYICNAIEDVATAKVADAAKKVILDRLGKNDNGFGGYHTVETWLRSKHIHYTCQDQVQSYRKRWLLALAEEFGSKK